jgi:hypothetical protein
VTVVREHRHVDAIRIFDVVDRFARDRGVRGSRPRPLSEVRFNLLARTVGGVRHEYDPGSTLVVRQTESGHHVFFGQVAVMSAASPYGSSGTAMTIPATGTLEVLLDSELYAPSMRLEVPVPEGRRPYPVLLEPGLAYPFPCVVTPPPPGALDQPGGPPWVHGPTLLRGVVRDSTGRGIPEASVSAEGGARRTVTDDNGSWVLDLPEGHESRPLAVTVALRDGRAATESDIRIRRHATTTVASITIPAL